MVQRFAVLVLMLSGCGLYFGSDPPVCAGGGGISAPPSFTQERDPQTGQCSYISGGDGGGCNPACGPCPLAKEPAMPNDWATCSGSCEALDEATCLTTSGCRAAYYDNGPLPTGAGSGSGSGGGSGSGSGTGSGSGSGSGTGSGSGSGSGGMPGTPASQTFWQCWETAPSGPIEGGGCAGLDAYTCSRHDDCSAVYSTGNAQTSFEYCEDEPTSNVCDRVDILCPTGSHCEQQCTPCDPAGGTGCMNSCVPACVADQSCANVDCGAGYTCVETCTAELPGGPGYCQVSCVPDGGPGACYGTISCNSAPPACPAGTTPGTANGCYTGYCIPLAACGPTDPGQCYLDPATVTCGLAPPACPVDTVPGVTNGCWSGFCIPTAQCPPPACEQLATESACTARPDCLAVYVGTDCLCYPDGHCTCASETYARCETLMGL